MTSISKSYLGGMNKHVSVMYDNMFVFVYMVFLGM